jgi:poly(A) polymerase
VSSKYIPVQLSPDEEKLFTLIADSGKELGFPVYVIGGYVRDKILKRPSKDMDVVCVGDGIALAEIVAAKLGKGVRVIVYKNFGTAMVQANEFTIEFVGSRKESYNSDSRNPIVKQGTLLDDLQRRDFTINALAISLNEEDYGAILDQFNGLTDIENKIIRTPLDPGITFSDDPLRMMRAIRFATQLNFTIEEKTVAAIAEYKERISIISQERITDELNKIILSLKPSIGFKLLFDTGLLALIFPELVKLQNKETRNGQSHKDNFYHTLIVLDNVAQVSDDLWLRWAAILHDIAKPVTKQFDPVHGWTFHGHEVIGSRWVSRIFRKFKLPSNEKMKFVEKLVLLHLRPISLTNENVTDSAIRRLLVDAGDDLESLLILCNADITSANKDKVKQYLANFNMVRQKLMEVEESDNLRNWQPPITGDIIMQTFHTPPGRTVGIIKTAVREAILDGKIGNNYEEAYNFMLEKGKELGLTKK